MTYNFRKTDGQKIEDIYQADLRRKIRELLESLNISNIEWTEWENDFIEDMAMKLERPTIRLSEKQYQCVQKLWDRI